MESRVGKSIKNTVFGMVGLMLRFGGWCIHVAKCSNESIDEGKCCVTLIGDYSK